MDVINPEIVRIGNRFYRRNPIREEHASRRETEERHSGHAPYREEEEIEWDIEEESDQLGIEQISQSPVTFRIYLPISSIFYPFLIGTKGRNKQKLELETRAIIKVPRTKGPVEVTGSDKRSIISAKTRIDALVASARERCDATHFVCLPVRSTQLEAKMIEFRKEVGKKCLGDRGLDDDSIFMPISKLHLTLGVCVLGDEEEVERIRKSISDFMKKEREMYNAFQVHLNGLEYMNDDPSDVDILYIKIAPGPEVDALQRFVDNLTTHLVAHGLMRRAPSDHIKLHITLINSRYRKDRTGGSEDRHQAGNRGNNARESFDATNLLKRFSDFDFGPVVLDQLHLSQRHRNSQDGFYWCAAQFPLDH